MAVQKKKISQPTENIKSTEGVKVNIAQVKTAPLPEDERNDLIMKHRTKAQKLARSLMRRWNARLDVEEIDSYVDLSLCEAAYRFSPAMGASFMTFLYYHLRGNLIRVISIAANNLVVPLFDSEQFSHDDEFHDGNYGSSALEIAESLMGSDNSQPDELLIKKEMVIITQQAKHKLDGLAQEVLDRMYVDEEQLNDIAADLGYSRCHISRVKRRALESLYDDVTDTIGLSAAKSTESKRFEEETEFSLEDLDETSTISPRLKTRRGIKRRSPRGAASIAMHNLEKKTAINE